MYRGRTRKPESRTEGGPGRPNRAATWLGPEARVPDKAVARPTESPCEAGGPSAGQRRARGRVRGSAAVKRWEQAHPGRAGEAGRAVLGGDGTAAHIPKPASRTCSLGSLRVNREQVGSRSWVTAQVPPTAGRSRGAFLKQLIDVEASAGQSDGVRAQHPWASPARHWRL